MKKAIDAYKNAYSGLSPATWWLSLVILINRSGTMVVPFMSIYLTESKHFTIGMAGWALSSFGAGAILGGYIGGRLTDKFGFYPVQLATLTGGGILFMVLGQVDGFWQVCLFTFVLSVVNESFRPANAAAIAFYSSEKNRTRSYSLNRLAINLGWAVGGTLGGLIAAYDYHLLFWVDGITNVGAAVLLLFVLAPVKNGLHQKTDEDVRPDARNSAYRDRIYLLFCFLTILFAFSFFQIFTNLPLHYKQNLGLSNVFIGITMAINGLLIVIFEMVVIHQLEGRRKKLYYITIGTLLMCASYIIFNCMPGGGLVVVLSMILITIGEMLSMPFMNAFWIGRAQKHNRGQYAGLYAISWSIAQVFAPGVGAVIAQDWGFDTLWWIIGGLSLVTAAGFKFLQKIAEPA